MKASNHAIGCFLANWIGLAIVNDESGTLFKQKSYYSSYIIFFVIPPSIVRFVPVTKLLAGFVR